MTLETKHENYGLGFGRRPHLSSTVLSAFQAIALSLASSEGTIALDAPVECPDAAYVAGRVTELVGREPEVDVMARIDRGDDGYELALHFADDHEVRTARDANCRLLADVVALIVAVHMDPVAAARGLGLGAPSDPPDPPDENGEEKDDPIAPEPATAQARVLTPAPQRAGESDPGGRPVGVALRVASAGGLGALPGFGPGVSGSVAVLPRLSRIELGVRYWSPREVYAQHELELGGRFSLVSAGARACFAAAVARFEFPICGGGWAGAMRGVGIGADIQGPQDSWKPWGTASATAGILWLPIPYVGLTADVEGFLTVYRTAFRLVEIDEVVHRAAGGGLRILAGVELRIPRRGDA